MHTFRRTGSGMSREGRGTIVEGYCLGRIRVLATIRYSLMILLSHNRKSLIHYFSLPPTPTLPVLE
jgi:hypothetical protein